jgi:hypothetical protein
MNFTISSSSAISSRKAKLSKAYSASLAAPLEKQLLTVLDENETSNFPSQLGEHPVTLTGIFLTYASKDVKPRKSQSRSSPGRWKRTRPNYPSKETIQRTLIEAGFLSGTSDESTRETDISKLDVDNSSLHLAAAFDRSPMTLPSLIDQGANVHAVNNAGQTFLHVLQDFSVEHCLELCSLLNRLRDKSFDFHQRDDHGQSPLHIITRPWVNHTTLDEIAAELHYSKILLLTSRDNLGRIVIGQFSQANIDEEELERLRQRLDCHASFSVERKDLPSSSIVTNYGLNTSIEIVDDLLLYEHHADLLRTIVRSCTSPQYEDSNGRNGLHCLAEVSLSLPFPNAIPEHD